MRSFCSGDTRAKIERCRMASAKLIVVEFGELGARHPRTVPARLLDAELLSDPSCGTRMVPGDHDHTDAGTLRIGDGVDHLGSRRVDDADDTEMDETVLEGLIDLDGDLVESTVGDGQRAKRVVGEPFDVAQNRVPSRRR